MPQALHCLLVGFAVYHKVSEYPTSHPNTYQQPPMWTISRDFPDTNKQGKDVEGEGILHCHVFFSVFFFVSANSHSVFPYRDKDETLFL